MRDYDDDGQKLVDDSGQSLIPFDPAQEYDENTATFLSAWAGSYRDVRGQLQATRKRSRSKSSTRSQARRQSSRQGT
eukprot:12412483-Karenia_brevis.AAC.1